MYTMYMKNKLYIASGILLILIIGAVVWGYGMFRTYAPTTYVTATTTDNGSGVPTSTVSTVDTKNNTVTPGAKTYTLADVATHKDATSCYTAISDSVYDLTLWINAHPGGPARILSICGIDGTNNFMNKHHGGAKFMTILERFKVGLFAK